MSCTKMTTNEKVRLCGDQFVVEVSCWFSTTELKIYKQLFSRLLEIFVHDVVSIVCFAEDGGGVSSFSKTGRD